jgi:hypothetical protein
MRTTPQHCFNCRIFLFFTEQDFARKPDAGDGERPKNISFQPLAILPKKSASWIYDGKKWLK